MNTILEITDSSYSVEVIGNLKSHINPFTFRQIWEPLYVITTEKLPTNECFDMDLTLKKFEENGVSSQVYTLKHVNILKIDENKFKINFLDVIIL